MKKVILIFTLSLFIIVGLYGCTNETSNQKSSPTHETIIPTKPSTSSSEDAIDYNKFTKKVWIMKSWDITRVDKKGAYKYPSFCISEINDGVIKGKFFISGIVPDESCYSPNNNLTGSINNGIAKCQFSNECGDKGNIELVFKKKDEIEATIELISKSEDTTEKFLDGTFLYRPYNPYNIKDIEGFSPFADNCFPVDLKIWGNVNFVSGKRFTDLNIPTLAFLTSKDGDILYDFSWCLPTNVDFYAVSIKDISKDGLKDIIIIFGMEVYSSGNKARILIQKPDGSFYVDGELDQEINDSDIRKDMETITEYLSKKF